jgi:cardiolipin synthase
MMRAFGLAAQRGVDVRVITPGIPDKKLVYRLTRSYYYGLVKNGVRVYEYTPGFCHAKMCVADDVLATCGTINLDYRSLYHHFENGCLYADCDAVMDTKKDFEETFAQCKEVTRQYASGRGAFLRFGQMILRLDNGVLVGGTESRTDSNIALY